MKVANKLLVITGALIVSSCVKLSHLGIDLGSFHTEVPLYLSKEKNVSYNNSDCALSENKPIGGREILFLKNVEKGTKLTIHEEYMSTSYGVRNWYVSGKLSIEGKEYDFQYRHHFGFERPSSVELPWR